MSYSVPYVETVPPFDQVFFFRRVAPPLRLLLSNCQALTKCSVFAPLPCKIGCVCATKGEREATSVISSAKGGKEPFFFLLIKKILKVPISILYYISDDSRIGIGHESKSRALCKCKDFLSEIFKVFVRGATLLQRVEKKEEIHDGVDFVPAFPHSLLCYIRPHSRRWMAPTK